VTAKPHASTVYVDSSVLIAALAPEESRHGRARQWLGDSRLAFATSVLTEVEVGRALERRSAPSDERLGAERLLEGCELIEFTENVRRQAVMIRPGIVRSLDAIHIATALVAGLEEFATFDDRQRFAAEEMGLVLPAGW
jgi:uncharacterized protein